jgi:N6-adenosine-specific RNA methylase IME4
VVGINYLKTAMNELVLVEKYLEKFDNGQYFNSLTAVENFFERINVSLEYLTDDQLIELHGLLNHLGEKSWTSRMLVLQELKKRAGTTTKEQFKEKVAKRLNIATDTAYRDLQVIEKAGVAGVALTRLDKLGAGLVKEALSADDFEKAIDYADEMNDSLGGKYTQSEFRKYIKKQKPKLKTPELPEGQFDVIYADPPWKYDFSETTSREIENKYPTMEVEEICAMNIPSAEHSVLFMWATAPKLRESLKVMETWGFEYKTNAIWDKEIIGMGYWFRGQHELLLVGVKGNFSTPDETVRASSVYKERRTEHSKKPDYYYNLIEKYFPNGKYLELFARTKHSDKWTVYGNQI